MLTFRKSFCFFLFAWVAIYVSGMASTATAQDHGDQPEWGSNPCEIDFSSIAALPETGALLSADHGDSAAMKITGLMPADFGTIVYDSNQGVCWLADANLTGNPVIRTQLGVGGITPDGLMDYPTALKLVDALNHYDNGRGFLGRNTWQLPDSAGRSLLLFRQSWKLRRLVHRQCTRKPLQRRLGDNLPGQRRPSFCQPGLAVSQSAARVLLDSRH
jgi:hypothetical protein